MTSIELGDRTIPLRFRVNARARRMILRVNPAQGINGEAVVTLPPGVGRNMAIRFAEERSDWIQGQLEKAPPSVRFADGAIIPYLGDGHVVKHSPNQRAPVVRKDGVLTVGGGSEHLSRRLTSWLKQEARRHIEKQVVSLSEKISRRHGRITIRDTRSRWGSCSSSGALSFSWRLVMAPEWVLEYVVAHEVAHLAEHNHSPAFWAIVAELNANADRARDWLNRNGEALHRYG